MTVVGGISMSDDWLVGVDHLNHDMSVLTYPANDARRSFVPPSSRWTRQFALRPCNDGAYSDRRARSNPRRPAMDQGRLHAEELVHLQSVRQRAGHEAELVALGAGSASRVDGHRVVGSNVAVRQRGFQEGERLAGKACRRRGVRGNREGTARIGAPRARPGGPIREAPRRRGRKQRRRRTRRKARAAQRAAWDHTSG